MIFDYGIFNEDGGAETVIDNDEEVSIKAKILFNTDVTMPTVSVTIKDFHGKEMCGTNTNFLGIDTGECKKDEEYVYEFKQKLRLAPGKYTLSVSCSRFDDNGELIVMNRNYDAIIFEVTSKDKMVGCFNLKPKVEFRKIDK